MTDTTLMQFIAILKTLVSSLETVTETKPDEAPPQKKPDPSLGRGNGGHIFVKGGRRKQVLDFFKQHPGYSYSSAQVAHRLKIPSGTASSCISDLRRRKKLVRIKRNKYTLLIKESRTPAPEPEKRSTSPPKPRPSKYPGTYKQILEWLKSAPYGLTVLHLQKRFKKQVPSHIIRANLEGLITAKKVSSWGAKYHEKFYAYNNKFFNYAGVKPTRVEPARVKLKPPLSKNTPLEDKILEYLRAHPDSSCDEIVRGTGELKNSVSPCLTFLWRDKKVERSDAPFINGFFKFDPYKENRL